MRPRVQEQSEGPRIQVQVRACPCPCPCLCGRSVAGASKALFAPRTSHSANTDTSSLIRLLSSWFHSPVHTESEVCPMIQDRKLPSSRVPHPTSRFSHLASSDHASRTSRSGEPDRGRGRPLNPRSFRITGRPTSWSQDFLPCRIFASAKEGLRAPVTSHHGRAAGAGPRSSRMTRPASVPVARCTCLTAPGHTPQYSNIRTRPNSKGEPTVGRGF